ncbi:hypothetical protein SAMN04488019_1289 [Phaeobacter italicus]|nr:hypothetical protein SAMN04488019_1289 [Phaeobacter italicus]
MSEGPAGGRSLSEPKKALKGIVLDEDTIREIATNDVGYFV